MKLTVFGANGPTGRLLVERALDAGHAVTAATRHPDRFPLAHDLLDLRAIDVYDRDAVSAGIRGADAVLSSLGVPFTRAPIDVYSTGARHLVEAMQQHAVKRLVVVSSSATHPHRHADGGFLLNRVVQPLVTRTVGRSTYADMRAMEELVAASDLAWTILRPSGLFDLEHATAYRLDEDRADGVFTARVDLAASMLDLLDDDHYVGRRVAVTTTEVRPSLLRMVLAEALG